jgi:hypothetical protein
MSNEALDVLPQSLFASHTLANARSVIIIVIRAQVLAGQDQFLSDVLAYRP